MQANDVNLDIADPKWQDGCAWWLAMGAISGGVNNIVTKPPDIAIGRGGLYLTTTGATIENGVKKVCYADISKKEPASVALAAVERLFADIGLVDVHTEGAYVYGTIFGSYQIKYGPLADTSGGVLNAIVTWYLYVLYNGNILKSYTGTVTSHAPDVYRLSVNKTTLDVGGYMQDMFEVELATSKIHVYRLGDTDYVYIDSLVFKDGVCLKVSSKTQGYTSVFDNQYLKFFCNPSTYTDLEQHYTGCYPVYVNGNMDQTLVISRYRSMVPSDAWLMAKEVGGRMGYVMSTHITYENGVAAFLVLDHGEQYAEYVDKYLENEMKAQNVTSYMVTERSDL